MGKGAAGDGTHVGAQFVLQELGTPLQPPSAYES
jgi:hypothetical protein